MLVEDDELAEFYLAPGRQTPALFSQQSAGLDGIDKVTLLHVPGAHLIFRESLLALFGYVAAFVGHFDKIFGHGKFNMTGRALASC